MTAPLTEADLDNLGRIYGADGSDVNRAINELTDLRKRLANMEMMYVRVVSERDAVLGRETESDAQRMELIETGFGLKAERDTLRAQCERLAEEKKAVECDLQLDVADLRAQCESLAGALRTICGTGYDNSSLMGCHGTARGALAAYEALK
jgi:chromosome segregation ATPase